MKANSKRKVFGDAVDLLMGDMEEVTMPRGVQMLPVKSIQPFHDHPFHLYEGERLEDMIASVKEHGVLNPVIVQKLDTGYEMLSGHNRWNAAKLAGLKEIPAIVKTDLSEEEAYVYVIETNLMQRSFSDLAISEKAAVLKARYEKGSCQGKRNDILNEIARLEGKSSDVTSGHCDQKLTTRDAIGKEYELSGSSVGRLLKLNDLIKPFKDMVDRGALYTKVALQLAFLPENEQTMVYEIMKEKKTKITIEMVMKLRSHSGALTEAMVKRYLSTETIKKKCYKVPSRIVEKYFEGMDPNQVDAIVEQALGSTVAKRNERLVKLLDGIAAMNLGSVKDHDIDAFGDAYEYLMTMYASNAGKSGGEFFTPADVSVLLTRLGTVGKTTINKVYDPACGSGSLLLKAEKLLGKEAVMNGFFGQEINITTYNLCRINMFLHDIDFDKFDIECEDTLTNPQHWDDEPFELIVSNPPYSIKWSGDDNPLLINDPRFAPAGVLAPKSKADLAFIMHSLSWLAPNGTAAIVCFPGIMYRGGAEKKIRQYLVDNNYIDCIIQLPSNLFFGTSISTCIMVLKKGKVDDKILFIDASKEFVKVTNNNRLTQENIQHIMDTYVQRTEIVHYAHVASHKEVVNNNYNLAVSTYVEEEDTREEIDIEDLENRIQDIVQQEDELRRDIESIIREIEGGTE